MRVLGTNVDPHDVRVDFQNALRAFLGLAPLPMDGDWRSKRAAPPPPARPAK